MSTPQEKLQVAKRWYQPQRVPLYIVVAGTFSCAAYFYYTRGQHPHVETNKAVRTDSLSEERDSAAQEGHDMKESIGRRVSRGTGMHQGMDTDGIFPNKKIAKAMGDVMGTSPAAKSEK